MTLVEKLERLKHLQEQKTAPDWELYKETWKAAIIQLQQTIINKWFNGYEEKNLMEFTLIPTKRIDPYIGEYLTTVLEITLTSNKYIILQPITAITAEYDGKLEFYMMGNVGNKATILRKIKDDNTYEWMIATPSHPKEHHKLNKDILEKLIDQWLQ